MSKSSENPTVLPVADLCLGANLSTNESRDRTMGPLPIGCSMQAFTIKCADDALAFLAKEGSQDRFESYLKTWMKKIQVMI
jgi:hypothetical protein